MGAALRVVVLGAGVVGVATAYQLARDGHEVVVLDRADGPAAFTSFANAGLVAPGHAYAWASPKAPAMMLRSLWRGDQAIRFKPRAAPDQWRWTARFLRECTAARAEVNSRRKAAISVYSQQMLREVAAETGLSYDQNTHPGLLYLYRSEAGLDASDARASLLRAEGVALERLDRAALHALEPALAATGDAFAGAMFAPEDESGDARRFTQALAARCEEMGTTFRYGVEIRSLERAGDGRAAALTAAVAADGARIEGDAFVLALGVMSPRLARELGVDLPIYPVKGYSMTLDVTDPARAPRRGGVDIEGYMAFCPMGDRLRITSTAEIGGYDDGWRARDFKIMTASARALFGGCADFDQPRRWAGLRPMTPTGLPIIDRAPIANLWLNTGHGSMGWTMANGSARILADLIGQRRPAIEREGMRYDA